MDNLGRRCFHEVTGGDVFSIKWSNSKKITIDIVLHMGYEQFFLVDIDQEKYWSQYNTLVDEPQTSSDIVNFFEFLQESGEAEVMFLGKLNKKEIYHQIASLYPDYEDLSRRKNKIKIITRSIDTLINKIIDNYELQQQIQGLTLMSGDILHTFSQVGGLIEKERLTIVGQDCLLLPINRKVKTPIQEEVMKKEELLEYLFNLVVAEGCYLVWESTFRKELPNITLSLRKSKPKLAVE